ncbi:autotransporter domain-containing protein [Luteibacter aegosomatissinici]|nr:autotransporter domain-containing protein [Luteibacter aegosomatissinici]
MAGIAGAAGVAGVGVIATGDATITNSGLISGGLNSDGSRANAVELSGGGNNLILEAGYQFIGQVISQGGDTLTLGGDTDATLSTAAIGSGSLQTIRGFNTFAKTGNSTWTLTDVNDEVDGNWTVTGGTLNLASDQEYVGSFRLGAGTSLILGLPDTASLTYILGSSGVSGTTLADNNGSNGTDGSDAVTGDGFTLNSTGSIQAGNGGTGGRSLNASTGFGGAGGNGGAGVTGTSFSLTSSGSISGGAGGAAGYYATTAGVSGAGKGGDGVRGTGFTLTNSGQIAGGAGGRGSKYTASASLPAPANGGAGGAGVTGSGFKLTNSGRILGGSGGFAGAGKYAGSGNTSAQASGGTGGAGVSGSGFTLINAAGGLISGGAGGSSSLNAYGDGGAGVVSTGGATVDNAGTIAGGAVTGGTQAAAVAFSGGDNHLIIRDGGSFSGNIVSTSGDANGGDTITFHSDITTTFDLASTGAVGSGTFIQGFTQFGKAGTGTMTLSGTASAAQSWTISGGSLVANTDSLAGNVTFAPDTGATANLTFNQATDGTYSGVISGDGSLTKDGAGVLTLTGNNTYTGLTTINAGQLLVSRDGVTGMLEGDVANNATLIFNRADTVHYGAVISGTGTLTQTGTGMLILNGANTYTGATTVTAGTLEVGDADHAAAAITSEVMVEANGTLRGHGTIDGNVVSDGIVWPGGSVGLLTINGNYTQNAGGTLQIDVTPTEASQLLVHGTASLAGTLSLVYAPGTYTTSTYTLLQADSVTGKFASTTSSGAVPTTANASVSYTSTAVSLSLSPTDTGSTPTNPTNPSTPSTPSTPATPPASSVVAPLDSGLYANLMHAANLAGQQSMNTVLGATLRPAEASCGNGDAARGSNIATSCGHGLWAQYTGGSNELTGENGLRSTTFGLQAGGDVAAGDVMHIGLEGGIDRINANDRHGGNGHVDNVHGGVYAFANAGPIVLSGLIDQSHASYRFNRQTGTGQATSSPDGSTTAAAIQAAWPIAAAQWQVTPAVGALYQHQRLDGFHDTVVSTSPLAASFALQGTRSTYTTMQPYVALAFSRAFTAGGVTYVPQFDVGYRYDTRDGNGPTVNALSQDGTAFALPGDTTGRGMTTVGARITAQAGASWNMYLDYQGQFSSHLNANALSVGFTKHF